MVSVAGFFRGPRLWLVLFLLLTLLPSAGLVWLGWRSLRQDRVLERQRMDERRNGAAVLTTTAIRQWLAATEQRLAEALAWPGLAGDGARIVVIAPAGIEIIPETNLLYYPFPPVLHEPPAGQFRDIEEEEFSSQAGDKAGAAYRRLAQSKDAAVRAGANMRLARLLRKTELPAALEVYAEMARLKGVGSGVPGVPADLLARAKRCELLAELKRSDELRTEAVTLDRDLETGQWRLERGVYFKYREEIDRWLGHESPTADGKKASPSEALAEAVSALWQKWMRRRGGDEGGAGRETLPIAERSGVVVWRSARDRLTALVAEPAYLERVWLAELDPLLRSQSVRVVLQDSDGKPAFGQPGTRDAHSIELPAAETGLPWSLTVSHLNPEADMARSDAQRRLFFAGLILVLLVVGAGSYFVGRAAARELAVARLQSDFVAAVSHEFRTPLTSLRQATELLEDGRLPELLQTSDLYRTQARAADRLQRLVESLLDFGRIDAGKEVYRRERFGLAEWARAAIESFQKELSDGPAHIDLQVHGEDEKSAAVDADPEALGRAFRNLIENALKYSPENPRVWINVGHRDDGYVAIAVRDEGLGIPANEQRQVFRKFVRGAVARKRGIKGTGVGLTMAYEIVRAHGGNITLQSEPGKGSTFTILLPEVRS
jgi:signal transduction histidine kinase